MEERSEFLREHKGFQLPYSFAAATSANERRGSRGEILQGRRGVSVFVVGNSSDALRPLLLKSMDPAKASQGSKSM